MCKRCSENSDECQGKECEDGIRKWLTQSVKPTLSEVERIILENINEDYNWIIRDSEGELYIFNAKPTKRDWDWSSISKSNEFYCYSHLFQFITWDDDEPYNIAELLEERNEKE